MRTIDAYRMLVLLILQVLVKPAICKRRCNHTQVIRAMVPRYSTVAKRINRRLRMYTDANGAGASIGTIRAFLHTILRCQRVNLYSL